MSNQRKSGVLLSYANIFISTILTIIYTPYAIRALGQSEFGLMSMASAVIGYLAILDLGFGNAIVVFTSRYITKNELDNEKKLHSSIFAIYILMAFLTLIIGGFFTYKAEYFFNSSMSESEIYRVKIMFLILTLNLAISFPFSIYSSILSAYEKFNFLKIVGIFRTIMAPVLIVPFLIFGFKAIAVVCIHCAVNLVCVIATYLYCKKEIKVKIDLFKFDKKLLKEVFAYSFFIFLGMVVDQVNWNVDKFILGSINGTTEVSIYSTATIINNMFITLSVTISGVMLPKMSKMVNASATNVELTDELIKVGRLQYYIIFFICSSFILFGREFIHIWAGKNYDKSYFITLILVLPVTIPLIQNLGISILQAKNMHKFRSIMAFFITILNVIISIPLAKLYGGIGTAIGTAIAIIILNIFIMNVYYHKKVGLDIIKFWKVIFLMSLKFLFVFFVMIMILHFCKFENEALKVLIGGGIYSILFIITSLFIMNDYEKSILNSLVLKFKRG